MNQILRKITFSAFCLVFLSISAAAQNVTVNPGAGSYPTLQAAFTAINNGTHTGVITVSIIGDTTETASAVLNASGTGSASYTSISITPTGARTVSGAITAGNPLIDFNGADNVTINGLNDGTNSLTISNTTASGTSNTSTIRFINGATGNTITNSNILGSFNAAVGTNGGNIFFSTDSSTPNGNDNNTISNNNIGPAGTNLPTKAIYGNGSTTTTAIGNSNITISGNNIFDFFGAAVSSAGIYISSGNTDWTIQNNKFYQTSTRTQTTGSQHSAIWIANSSGNNFQIIGNTIGFAAANGTGTYNFGFVSSSSLFIPIFLNVGTTTATSVQGNTIAGINMTGAGSGTSNSAPFRGIYVSAGLTTVGDVTGNTVGSLSTTGSIAYTSSSTSASDVIAIFNFGSSNWTTNNNNIGGFTVSNSSTGATNFYGLRANTGSSVTWNCANNTVGGTVANSINDTSTAAGTIVNGILNSNPIGTFSGNTIRNMTVAGGTGTTTSASMVGIVATNSSNNTLTANQIYNLSNTNTSAATVVTGIQFSGTGTANVIERNFIYNLSSATNSASAEVNGIRIGGGTSIYRNNMIDIGAGVPNAIGAAATNSGTTGVVGINEFLGTDNIFHNSIYIGGSPTAGTGASYAFNGVQTSNTRSFRDNIFFNARSNNGATGKNYAVKINGTTANPSGLTINNNIYFVNGTGGTFGFFNSVDVADLSTWKTAVGQDANSFFTNPQYLNPTLTTPDLHLNPSVATVAEGNGADVGVLNDYDNELRANLTPVDIGADAGNYMGIDLSPPNITYTSFGNTSSTTNRTLTVTITDATGVATGSLAPRIYFKKSTDANYVSTACSITGGTAQNGTYACTIDYSLVGGGVSAGNTIQYFVVAQDTLSNLAANPAAGFAGTDVNNFTSPPTTPNSYQIVSTFSGSVTVDAAGAINSLTNTGGLFDKINQGTISGNVTVSITSDLTAETGAVALNQTVEEGAGNYTITIQPSGGAARLISGSNATALINLNGADRVIFNGLNTGGNSLTIRNTGAGNTIRFTNDAVNNQIQNATVEGSSGSIVILLNNTGPVTGNDNITINNSTIRDRSDTTSVPATLISNTGPSATITNSNTVITNNQLINFTSQAISFSNTDNINISGNTISQTAVRTSALNVISFALTLGTNTVSNNVIRNQSTNSAFTGMSFGDVRAMTVSRNQIYSIDNNGGTTSTFTGAIFNGASGNPSSLTMINNFISIVPTTNSNQTIYGVRDFAFSGNTINFNFNTVLIGGTATGSATWAYQRGGGTPTNTTMLDNILFNSRTGGSVNHFAVGDASANTGTWSGNYNLFVGTGATAANFFDYGTTSTGTPVSFATWQAGPPTRDANSQASNPGGNYAVANMFISMSDLHLKATGTNPALTAGNATGTGVTADIDNDTRDATPDIGADELVQGNGGTLAGGTYYNASPAPNATLSGNVTITNSLNLNGILNTGSNTLTIDCNGSISGANASNYVVGAVAKNFCSTGSFTYPVGDAGGTAYSPMTANVTGLTTNPSSLKVLATNTPLVDLNPTKSLARNWDLTLTGALTADLTFQYLVGDVNGNESTYIIFKKTGTSPSTQPGGTCNAATHSCSITGVTSFSKWSAGEPQPTAAGAIIGGRVTDARGRAIGKAQVVMVGQDGSIRYAITNPFGYYRFVEVPVGASYTISATAKNHAFAPRVVIPNGSLEDVDFVAQP
jgi:hypothetical protein